jgi:hypothetical protein
VREVEEKIRKPMPVGRILRLCNINYLRFKQLVDEGILVFVENRGHSKRYCAVNKRNET